MTKLKSKKWWIGVVERAIKTFAEVALSFITVGQAFVDVNWVNLLSVSGTAVIISILTSIATLPEDK